MLTIVSRYDEFLGTLLRVIWESYPDMVFASEKQLSFSEIKNFKDIGEARDYIIEREVESVLRKSHKEQFDYLENILGVELKKLDVWPDFIEATERRNLYAHTGGHVSRQYLKNCKENGVVLDKSISYGDYLNFSLKYFESTLNIFLEIGVKLGHVIWRKLRGPCGMADTELNNICFDLIQEEKYGLALKFLTFSTETPSFKFVDDLNRRILIVNKALAFKLNGKEKKAMSILDAEDWTSCGNNFLIGCAVLRDNFKLAAKVMGYLKIEKFDKVNYLHWPLFKEFRVSSEFLDAYENIYGEPFNKKEQRIIDRSI